MTPEQRATLEWIRRAQGRAAAAQQAILVNLGEEQGYKVAVIYPGGSYSTATLGTVHDAPHRLAHERDSPPTPGIDTIDMVEPW